MGVVAQGDNALNGQIAIGESTAEGHLQIDPEIGPVQEQAHLAARRGRIATERFGDGEGRVETGQEFAHDESDRTRGAAIAGLLDFKPEVVEESKKSGAVRKTPDHTLVGENSESIAHGRDESTDQLQDDGAVENRLARHRDPVVFARAIAGQRTADREGQPVA